MGSHDGLRPLRFFVLWVIASNVGFFPGMALGRAVTHGLPEPLAAGLTGACFASCVGLAQWLVLRRELPDSGGWVAASGLGWAAGGALGALALRGLLPGIDPDGLLWSVALGAVGGAGAGVLQAGVLRKRSGIGIATWTAVSALGWGVLFPGVVTGIALSRWLAPRPPDPANGAPGSEQ